MNLSMLAKWLILAMLISTYFCQAPEADPDYQKQQTWKGQCNIGNRQSPINIVSNDAKFCPFNKQFEYNYTRARISVHPFGKNLKSIFSQQTFIKYLSDEIMT